MALRILGVAQTVGEKGVSQTVGEKGVALTVGEITPLISPLCTHLGGGSVCGSKLPPPPPSSE